MKRRWAASIITLVCVVSAGCADRPITLQTQPRAFDAHSYKNVYRAWTRSKEDFSWVDLRHVLRVTATFESWEFRWAYLLRYANDNGIDKATQDEMLQASLSRAKKEHRFFVALVGYSRRESNLASRVSAWRVLLVAPDGRQVEPISLERIRRPTPSELVYFPATSLQREMFRVSFPATDENGQPLVKTDDDNVVLRFTGPRGKVDLQWNLVPEAQDRSLSWREGIRPGG